MLEKYPDLLTTKEIMEIFRCGRNKTYEIVEILKPHIKIGKKILIPKSVVIKYLQEIS